jgi:hypothetical protein
MPELSQPSQDKRELGLTPYSAGWPTSKSI